MTKKTFLGTPETDPAKNAAADQIIGMTVIEGTEPGDVSKALIKQAGKALANRHVFILQGYDDDGDTNFSINCTAIAVHTMVDIHEHDSTLIRPLLPKGLLEAAELVWEYKKPKSIEDAVREFHEAGFMWSPELQKETDRDTDVNLTKRIAKVYAEMAEPKVILHPGAQETDAEKNAAADQVIEQVINENSEISDELIEKAGRKALANRHMFAIYPFGYGDEGGFTVYGSSIAYYTKHGKPDERTALMNQLLPDDMSEVDDGNWVYNDESKDMEEAIRELRDAGFAWDEKWQRDMDKAYGIALTKKIAQVYAETAPKTVTKKQPAKKAGKTFKL